MFLQFWPAGDFGQVWNLKLGTSGLLARRGKCLTLNGS